MTISSMTVQPRLRDVQFPSGWGTAGVAGTDAARDEPPTHAQAAGPPRHVSGRLAQPQASVLSSPPMCADAISWRARM